jgi:hypothetical protein
VSDARAVVQALSELLNQGFGRPSGETEDRTVVVNRRVNLVAEEDELPGEDEREIAASTVTTGEAA